MLFGRGETVQPSHCRIPDPSLKLPEAHLECTLIVDPGTAKTSKPIPALLFITMCPNVTSSPPSVTNTAPPLPFPCAALSNMCVLSV